MATSVGQLYYDLGIDDKQLDSGLDQADKKIAVFSEKIANGMKTAAKGLAVVGAGLTLYAKSATDFTIDLVKSSKALAREIGVSTEEASRLVAALGRVGITTEDASTTFGIFSRKIVEATKEAGEGAANFKTLQLQIEATKQNIKQTTEEIKKNGDKSGELDLKLRTLNNTLVNQQAEVTKSANAFQRLGINTLNAQGSQKDFNTLLFEVADKFKAMPDGIDKTALSMELFGRSGKDMIKVLNLGSDGIKNLEEQADKLGLTLNADIIGKVNELITAQKDLKGQTDALRIAIGTATAPVLTKFNTTLNDFVAKLLESEGPLRTITVLLLSFGGPVFSAASSIAALGASLVGMGLSLATLGLVLVAILAIAAAAYLIYTNWETVKQWFFNALEWFKTNWPYLLAILTGPFGLAVLFINKNWQRIMDMFSAAVGWFADIGRRIGNALASGMTNAIEGVKGIIKAALNWIIDKANTAIKGVNKVSPPGVPEIGTIPKFRNGVENFAGGLAFVHKGEALVNMSPGTSVIKASEVGSRVGGGKTEINIGSIGTPEVADYFLQKINRNYNLEGMGLSPVGQ